jgi:hypothetical protein
MADTSTISACGIDCAGCEYKKDCGGSCHEGGGKPFYIKDFGVEICPIFDCAVNKKGYRTCGECDELPCQIILGWRDPSMSEEAHVKAVNENAAFLKSIQ